MASVFASLQETKSTTINEENNFNAAILSELHTRTTALGDDEKNHEFRSTIKIFQQGIEAYVQSQKRATSQQPTQRPACFDVAFEKILKYVQLPVLPLSVCHGKPPVNLVLDWLYECKGVRRIFEVRVDDLQNDPHSEEDIEKSLRRFRVTNLDWRRTDLSVYAIHRAAPQVKQLHLYSSGNLGTLDHWLGQNGLRRLEKVV